MAWQPKGNIKGPQGIAGPPGAQGATGAQGPVGAPGERWFSGAGSPITTDPIGSAPGDWYLNTTNGDVYENVGGTWTLRLNIKGPTGNTGAQGAQGPQGATGAQGTPGAAGEVWWSGAGAPATGTGAVGDWYLNTSTGDVYEKTGSTTWTLRMNIKGPTGATGSQGPQGATGSQGAQGIQGPQGPAAPPSVGTQVAAAANPTGTANTSGVMMGYGRTPNGVFNFVPTIAGSSVLLMISASIACSVASGMSVVGIRYGTGTPPANGQAATGTAGPAYVRAGATAANEPDFFTIPMVVTGLSVGVTYWVDLVIQAGAAGQTTSVTGAFFTAVEIP